MAPFVNPDTSPLEPPFPYSQGGPVKAWDGSSTSQPPTPSSTDTQLLLDALKDIHLTLQNIDANLNKTVEAKAARATKVKADIAKLSAIAEEERAKISLERERRATEHDPSLTIPARKRDGDHCRRCGVLVTWAGQRNSRSGEYLPIAPNGIRALVVVCRECRAEITHRGLGSAPLRFAPKTPFYGAITQKLLAEAEPALAVKEAPTVLEILSGYTTENWADVPPVGLTKAFCPQCGKPGPHKRETVQDGETNNQFFLCTECASLNHLDRAIRQFENSVDNLVHCTACAGWVDRTQMVFAYSHSWLVCKPCLDRIVR